VAALLRSRFVRASDQALLALSGDLVAAVIDARPPVGLAALNEDDRQALVALRTAVPRWLSRVDRVPPAELIDDLLRETAYDYELRGSRAVQAHENVKKLRMLIRRLQNRGYLTMARLADHLARLSAGDESNAVVDATDAVNLMTVHAAKGLEFPVVFVADLGRGAGRGEAIRVMPDDGTGKPAVEVAGFRSSAERAQRDAAREEAKRLLYVALTRARDRLYLAGRVKRDRLLRGRGSLAEVLPLQFVSFLVGLAPGDGASEAAWRAPSGHAHRFQRLSQPAGPGNTPGASQPPV